MFSVFRSFGVTLNCIFFTQNRMGDNFSMNGFFFFFATWSSGKKMLKGKSGNTELLELKKNKVGS